MHREVFGYVEDGFEEVDVVALDLATLQKSEGSRVRRVVSISASVERSRVSNSSRAITSRCCKFRVADCDCQAGRQRRR